MSVTDTQAGVIICDVMGHGIRAALVTAILRGLVQELRPLAADPGAFLTEVNQQLMDIFGEMKEVTFTSALYMLLDAKTGQASYANAGLTHVGFGR